MTAPKLSVLLAVHNGEPYLKAALDSVLAQDFRDFELVVVDDGSTDAGPARVAALADPRVRLRVNERNLGHTPSLNIGLRMCRGEYVARMDADDLCRPGRFAKQVAFLDANPDVGILGGACRVVDGTGRRGAAVVQPADDSSIRWLSMTKNPFHHPTVVLRRAVLLAAGAEFDERYGANQDYDLWDRLLPCTKAANLTDEVLDYRIHGGNISVTRMAEQQEKSLVFGARRIATEAGLDAAPADLAGVYSAVHGSRIVCATAPSSPARALDALLDWSDAFFARHPDAVAARRLAAGLAMRAWLLRPMGTARRRLLARILRVSAAAPFEAARILVPQIAGAARRLVPS